MAWAARSAYDTAGAGRWGKKEAAWMLGKATKGPDRGAGNLFGAFISKEFLSKSSSWCAFVAPFRRT